MSIQGLKGLFESDLFKDNRSVHFVKTKLPDYFFRSHWHNSIEVIYCHNGNSKLTINGRDYVLCPSDILFIPATFIHSFRTPPHNVEDSILNIPVSTMKLFPSGTAGLFQLPAIAHITANNAPAFHTVLIELFQKIEEEFLDKRNHYYDFITAYSFQMMLHLEREIKANPAILDITETREGKRNLQIVDECISYVEEHFREELTVKELANALGYSDGYLSQVFSCTTHYTILEYINKTRIKAAAALLIQSKQPVTAIALQAGFQSIATFNRVFKKYMGCSPTEYRKKA
ncbi:MAG: helix-turn-helix domain-containing protein [Lachnospiraceae bacterium]